MVADLTVDGTMSLGGAICILVLSNGQNIWVAVIAATLAGMIAGFVTGIFHTGMGIPVILSGILTQLGLYSINLKILGGKSNQAISADNYDLIISLRYVRGVPFYRNTILIVALFVIAIIAILYWFFGTERGCSIRATGCNPNMSRAQGINTNFNTVLGLMISNGLVGLQARCIHSIRALRTSTPEEARLSSVLPQSLSEPYCLKKSSTILR